MFFLSCDIVICKGRVVPNFVRTHDPTPYLKCSNKICLSRVFAFRLKEV